MSSLSVGNDCITLEEVKSSLSSRKLRHKASGNSDEVDASGLTITNYEKGQKKKKIIGNKKGKVDPKDICNYYKKLGYWKKDCPKKIKRIYCSH